MNELTKINNGGQISFIKRPNPLTQNQKKVLQLLESCLSKAIVLDSYILQDWYMEEIIKPRMRMVNGKYLGYKDERGEAVFERLLEYDYLTRLKEENGGLVPYYLTDAKNILKSCIGALVVKGFLMAIPNVSIDNIPESKQLN